MQHLNYQKNKPKSLMIFSRLFVVSILFACMLVVSNATARGVTGKQGILEISTIAGKRIDLKQYRGKVVLVAFWATWCNTCVVEMPALQKYYAKHKSTFELLAISVDRTDEELKGFVKQHKLTYPVAWREAKNTKSNFDNIQTTPTMFVVDPKGKVVKKLYGRLSEKKLQQLIKQYSS